MSTKEKEIQESEFQDQEVESDLKPEVEIDTEGVILNKSELNTAMDEMVEDVSVDNYTAPVSRVNHCHDTKKHDVRNAYSVRDEFVDEHFADEGVAPNDHAALWFMSYRKDEFIAADEEIFEDTHDTDQSRWDSIESRKKSAPIPPETHNILKP